MRVTGGHCACLKNESYMNIFGLVSFKPPFSVPVLHFKEILEISGS